MSRRKASRVENLFESLRQSSEAPVSSTAGRKRGTVSVATTERKGTSPALYTLEVPMRLGEQISGYIQLIDETPFPPEGEEYRFVQQVGEQLALALENARLFQEVQRRAEEMTILNDMARDLALSLALSEVWGVLERYLPRMFPITSFLVALYDSRTDTVSFPLVVENKQRKSWEPRKRWDGLTEHVVRTRRSLLLSNVPQQAPELGIQLITLPLSWLGAPLMVGEKVLGVIALRDLERTNVFTEEHQRLLEAIASGVAITIQNSMLFQEASERALQQNALYILSNQLAQTRDLREICKIAVRIISERLGFAFSAIFLLDPLTGDRVLQAQRGWEEAPPDWRIPADKGLSRLAVQTGRVYYWPDVTQHPEYVPGLKGAHTEVDVPIKVGEQVIGVLIVEDPQVDAFTPEQLELLQAVASVLAVNIENVRLLEETQRRAEDIAFVNRVVGTIATTLNFKQALQTIVREIVEYLPVDHGGLTLFEEGKEFLTVVAEHGKRPLHSVVGVRFRVSENPSTQEVLRTRQPLFIEDVQNDPRVDQALREEFRKRGIVKLVIFPILAGEEVIGTLGLDIVDPQVRLSSSQIALVQNILGQISLSIQRAQLFEQVQASRQALQRQNEYLAAVAEIGRLVTSALDLPTIFKRAVNLVRERFGYYHAAIFTVEETGFNAILQEATGEAGAEMKRRKHSLPVGSKSIVGTVTATGQPLVVNDVSQNPIHRFNPLLPETRAEAAFPLRIGQRVIGVLDVQSTQVNAFAESDVSALQMLADQIAVAIDNARSYQVVQDAMREMREADRMKSQFLANMSHELRTPLNSIIGFSRVILKGIDGPITELQRQDLTAIYNSGQHLLGLINDILDLSKIEAGKMELAFEEVNLVDIINGVMSTATGLVKDKPITLKRSVPKDLPTVRADATRIRQVLLNLVSNAAKFTEQGEIEVSASVQTGPDGQPEVLVKVRDTGPGISEEDQQKLFQPFSQVDASLTRKTGGTGLGLAISAQLIQLHGGRIGVQSKVGEGSTFYFTVPFYQKTPAPSPDRRLILAIDDDPQVIALYERYLASHGYQIIGLTEPRQAVEQVRRLKPFAITLDIMMPGYDGWQVLVDLKSNPETRDIPVIICSILDEREKGFSLGAADYLIKPILQEDLVQALDRLNGDGSIREVLIIDDNVNDLRLLAKILQEGGRYQPILAEGGEKGWNLLLQRRPHAVILDLFMPDLDGFTFLERLRTTPELRDIPVVVISGVELTPEQLRQLQEFGQRLIQKGAMSETELFSTLERALKRVRR